MKNSEDEYLSPAELIENQMLWKSRDQNSPHVAEFCMTEGANSASLRIVENAQQG